MLFRSDNPLEYDLLPSHEGLLVEPFIRWTRYFPSHEGSDGLLPTPLDALLYTAVVLSLVLRVETSCFTVGGGVGIGVTQEGLDRGEDGGDIVDRAPLVL